MDGLSASDRVMTKMPPSCSKFSLCGSSIMALYKFTEIIPPRTERSSGMMGVVSSILVSNDSILRRVCYVKTNKGDHPKNGSCKVCDRNTFSLAAGGGHTDEVHE